MANPEHVEIVKQGVAVIAAWRKKYPDIRFELGQANLSESELRWADLSGANLSGANLSFANVSEAYLFGANVKETSLECTIFANVDLSEVNRLESVRHFGPSTIGVDTLYKSQGKIPEAFLRGCGVPDDFITYLPSLVAKMRPMLFQSCFISYSSKENEFARRLYNTDRTN